MTVRLSSRLQTIAELVPYGARVIDVGTDHGMLPVWLAQTGRIQHAWASDLRPGPLARAADLIRDSGVDGRVSTKLTDGLDGFSAEEGDTVIIAGMGGETIVSILSECDWIGNEALLILAPQSKQDILRRWLLKNGLSITSEKLTEDAGRIYPILTARGGMPEQYSEAELHTGAFRLLEHDPLFGEYLDLLILRGKKAAPYDAGAAALMAEFESMKERLKQHDESK